MRSQKRHAQLLAEEAGCLRALRSGASSKSRIAVVAGLDLRRAQRALERLADKRFAVREERPGGRVAWAAASPEQAGVEEVDLEAALDSPLVSSDIRPGTAAARLLDRLDAPKRSTELARELGVTPQRVHQIIVRLLALGLVRPADPAMPTRVVARAEDPTQMLDGLEERVLSSLPDDQATTAKKLAARLKLSTTQVEATIANLATDGLVQLSGQISGDVLYRLTTAGAANFQRDRSSRPADLPKLPVQSDRVRLVLDHLAERGPARTFAIARELALAPASINALMQYLKRRGLVAKAGPDLKAPHDLTPEGRRVRDEMALRAKGALYQ
jgi:Mn-dependent DtxR family transcriptional regulator